MTYMDGILRTAPPPDINDMYTEETRKRLGVLTKSAPPQDAIDAAKEHALLLAAFATPWKARFEAIRSIKPPPVKDGEVLCTNTVCGNAKLNRLDHLCWKCGGDTFAVMSPALRAWRRVPAPLPPRMEETPREAPVPAAAGQYWFKNLPTIQPPSPIQQPFTHSSAQQPVQLSPTVHQGPHQYIRNAGYIEVVRGSGGAQCPACASHMQAIAAAGTQWTLNPRKAGVDRGISRERLALLFTLLAGAIVTFMISFLSLPLAVVFGWALSAVLSLGLIKADCNGLNQLSSVYAFSTLSGPFGLFVALVYTKFGKKGWLL